MWRKIIRTPLKKSAIEKQQKQIADSVSVSERINDNLKKDNLQLLAELEEKQQQRVWLIEDIEAYWEKRESAKASFIKENNKLSGMLSLVREKEKQIKEIDKTKISLDKELDEYKHQINKQKIQESSELNRDLIILNEDVLRLNREKVKLLGELDKFKVEITDLNRRIEKWVVSIDKYKQDIDKLKKENKQLADKNKQQKTIVWLNECAIKDLEKEKASKSEQLDLIKNELSMFTKDLDIVKH